MCKTIKTTRWRCYATRRCRPRNPLLPHLDLLPPPHVLLCPSFNAALNVCSAPTTTPSPPVPIPFLKTLECPRHHRKRLANLQEAWDEAWTTQILSAQPGLHYRRAALSRRAALDRQRDAFLRTLEASAERLNVEFYGEAHWWQGDRVQQVMNELVHNLI